MHIRPRMCVHVCVVCVCVCTCVPLINFFQGLCLDQNHHIKCFHNNRRSLHQNAKESVNIGDCITYSDRSQGHQKLLQLAPEELRFLYGSDYCTVSYSPSNYTSH